MGERVSDRLLSSASAAFPRRAAQFNGLWSGVLVAALALAVIVGILTMHFVASPVSHSGAAATTTLSLVSDAPHHAVPVAMTDCAGCTDDMPMAMMWCILALLTAALLLLAPWRVRREYRRLHRRHRSGPAGLRRIMLFLSPPSLVVLCISRT